MVNRTNAEKFSCRFCGTPYDAYPPDSRHNRASVNEKDYEDPIKVNYKCKGEGCGETNTLYWGREKISFSVM